MLRAWEMESTQHATLLCRFQTWPHSMWVVVRGPWLYCTELIALLFLWDPPCDVLMVIHKEAPSYSPKAMSVGSSLSEFCMALELIARVTVVQPEVSCMCESWFSLPVLLILGWAGVCFWDYSFSRWIFLIRFWGTLVSASTPLIGTWLDPGKYFTATKQDLNNQMENVHFLRRLGPGGDVRTGMGFGCHDRLGLWLTDFWLFSHL